MRPVDESTVGSRLDPVDVAILFAGVLIVAFFLAASFQRTWGDFVAQYVGAKLVGTPDLYHYDAVTQMELRYDDYYDSPKPFWRPPFYAAALSPLGKLPYRQALVVWQILNLAALAGFVLLWPRDRLMALGLCLWFVPVWNNISLGQDMFLILLFVGAAYACWARGWPFAAGVVISLCAFKPALFLLLPVFIVSQRLWRLAAGVLTGGALLFLVSCLAAGWGWLGDYVALLKQASSLVSADVRMANLEGILVYAPWLGWARVPAVLAVVISLWAACRRIPFDLALGLTLAAGLLVSPRALLYDAVILLPVLTRLAESRVLPVLALVACGFGVGNVTFPGVEILGQLWVVVVYIIAFRAVGRVDWRVSTF